MSRSALLVIDMQNDFLTEGGAFTKRHCDPVQLAQTVAWLARASRQQGRLVAWITSAYGAFDGPVAEGVHGETHTGAPCCVPGTWGAQLVATLEPVHAERGQGERRFEKRWYSAFRDTDLHAWLTESGVVRVVLCGVATDRCVLTTARDARRLGYEVDVIDDATTAGTASKHTRALREIEALGGRRRAWGELLAEGAGVVRVEGLGAGDTTLWCGALGDVVGDGAYDALEREVAWSAMFHRGGEVPRRVAIQGSRTPDGAEPLYRHPVDEQPAMRDWTPVVDALRRAVERRVGHPLNHCLLQLYRNGRDWISEHSDKTLDVARPSSIVNVSLGHMRTMLLRPKPAADLPRESVAQRIPLPHGSFLVMGLETNRAWYHAIRQQADDPDDGPRISLTFRHIGSWVDPATDAVWGTGAPTMLRADAEQRALARAAFEGRDAAERAEAEALLRLFREENVNPRFDAASYRPGFEVLNFRSLQ